ncbi:MAG: four helix bundle protein [Crocinitomix sp.]|nr:four helix bundle protein [Crocinitomix sp.]
MEKKNDLLDLTYEFSLKIIKYCEELDAARKFAISNQLIRSGTSIGANAREAQNVHGRKDFVARLIISAKEADESEYWLMLCRDSEGYPDPKGMLELILRIKKLLSKIIAATKRNY